MHCFSTLFGKDLFMFQTDLLSAVRSLILYSQRLVFVILIMLTVCKQTVNITSITTTYCCEYTIKTPDNGH